MSNHEINIDLADSFKEAIDLVTSTDKIELTNEIKLQFYGLYKRAIVGKCSEHGKKPWGWDFEGLSKYEAWNKNEYLTVSQCMQQYITLLESTKQKMTNLTDTSCFQK